MKDPNSRGHSRLQESLHGIQFGLERRNEVARLADQKQGRRVTDAECCRAFLLGESNGSCRGWPPELRKLTARSLYLGDSKDSTTPQHSSCKEPVSSLAGQRCNLCGSALALGLPLPMKLENAGDRLTDSNAI